MTRKRTRKRRNKGTARLKKQWVTLVTLALVACLAWFNGDYKLGDWTSIFNGSSSQGVDHTLIFPSERYPETANHIRSAVKAGHSDVCTIDRDGAEANRDLSLKGVPVKKGKDRDEWPMAMCAEGGANADIQYITPKDNRGAGSWVGNQLSTYPNGTRVKFVVE
ncbi:MULTISPECIES: NucA/NucB deoxyribonuclease domain-containing protein [Paenibacillus]|uniref:DNA-entry nuclease n=2 Tax=Paenibacillus TaxID=44249 RepID=A0AAP5LQC5_PAEAM|nr:MULTISPECIES: NucA/NucB deoxyribonuclease domain-containing protein [Paenibacillus]KQY87505.1 DNA-entry nuclease [Paenibacillus sp. Root52]MDQ0168691.1 hypothetical protein [Paenibacillus tundrae]MDR6725343.1 hypothetical protein [Paenibacillus amylolyticus]